MSTLKANKYENTATSDGGINIDSAGKVGVNTSAPFGQLQVKAGTDANFSVTTASSEASLEIINDAGSANVALNTRASVYKIKVNSTETLRVTSDGLTFNGDTAAANALDDYEEGSFTPTLTGASGSPTHLAQKGDYTKIGRLVHCRIHMSISAKSTLSGALRISSLPFTVSNIDTSTSLDFSGVLSYFNNTSSTAYFISASPVGNSTTAALYFRGSTNLTDVLEAGDLDNDFDFRAHLIYYV